MQIAHSHMGADQSGRVPLSEMELWWRENDVDDPGMRDGYRRLWRALEGETARVRWEQLEERRDKSRQQRS